MWLAVANLIAAAPAGPIAVAPDVHPMPSPALSIARILQKAIDHFLISGFGRVLFKRQLLLGCGREANEIEVNAAEQDGFRSFGARLETALLMFGGNERIHRIAHPSCIFHPGHRGLLDAIQRAPPIRAQILRKLFLPRLGLRQLLFGWRIFRIAWIVPEQQFDFVWHAIAIGILFGDERETSRNILVLACPFEVLADFAQAITEWIVRKFLQRFRIFVRAREMAGSALI